MNIEEINALLDDAKPMELSYSVCLRKDLVAEYEVLQAEFEAAQETPGSDSLAGGDSKARETAEKMNALTEQMRASTIVLRLRALPRKQYKKLTDRHPPRKDDEGNVHPEDRGGVNSQTFPEPLIRACLVEPVLDAARLAHLLDEVLSDRQFDVLANKALEVNRADVDIPFSSAASSLIQGSKPE